MTKDLMILGLGVWVALVPFLGFPNRWDTFIFVISGVLIVILVLLLRRDFVNHITSMKTSNSGKRGNTFVESTGRVSEPSVPPKPTPSARQIIVEHESTDDNGKDKEART